MQDACVGTESQPNIEFSLSFSATVQIFYGIIYLQEIDDNATATNVRSIRIQVHFNDYEANDFNVTREVNQDSSASFNLSNSAFSATLSRLPESRLFPLANAAEYYFMTNVSSNSTDANDGKWETGVTLQTWESLENDVKWQGASYFPFLRLMD